MKLPDHTTCPCHSGQLYGACCAPRHRGEPAPDALKLMRSRYCAYALGMADYVMATTCAHGPAYQSDANAWRAGIVHFARTTQFLGLKVTEVEHGTDVSHVAFQARLLQDKRLFTLVERSRFRRKNGGWCYLSGETHVEEVKDQHAVNH